MKGRYGKQGFTLIELLVVIAIFGILVLAALYTWGRSAQQVRLQMSVEQVASQLRFDQNRVKSGQLSPAGSVRCLGASIAPGSTYNTVEAVFASDCGSAVVVNSLSHSTGVELVGIADQDGDPVTGVDILFQPPNGAVVFRDALGQDMVTTTSIDFTFSYTLDPSYPVNRVMTVNRSGQITY